MIVTPYNYNGNPVFTHDGVTEPDAYNIEDTEIPNNQLFNLRVSGSGTTFYAAYSLDGFIEKQNPAGATPGDCEVIIAKLVPTPSGIRWTIDNQDPYVFKPGATSYVILPRGQSFRVILSAIGTNAKATISLTPINPAMI